VTISDKLINGVGGANSCCQTVWFLSQRNRSPLSENNLIHESFIPVKCSAVWAFILGLLVTVLLLIKTSNADFTVLQPSTGCFINIIHVNITIPHNGKECILQCWIKLFDNTNWLLQHRWSIYQKLRFLWDKGNLLPSPLFFLLFFMSCDQGGGQIY
jgi:hypothetical protein